MDAWLSHLASKRNVAINTQKTALNAIVFLYKQFLKQELGEIQFINANRGRQLPTVFTHDEAMRVLSFMSGDHRLAASLMYGAGLRVMEAVRLRVQDVDFTNEGLFIREAKGDKCRRTLLPKTLIEPLKAQIDLALAIHKQDLTDGFGEVYLPYALAKKYPKASKSPAWQYVFPAPNRAVDPRSDMIRRHHIGEQFAKEKSRTSLCGFLLSSLDTSINASIFSSTPAVATRPCCPLLVAVGCLWRRCVGVSGWSGRGYCCLRLFLRGCRPGAVIRRCACAVHRLP